MNLEQFPDENVGSLPYEGETPKIVTKRQRTNQSKLVPDELGTREFEQIISNPGFLYQPGLGQQMRRSQGQAAYQWNFTFEITKFMHGIAHFQAISRRILPFVDRIAGFAVMKKDDCYVINFHCYELVSTPAGHKFFQALIRTAFAAEGVVSMEQVYQIVQLSKHFVDWQSCAYGILHSTRPHSALWESFFQAGERKGYQLHCAQATLETKVDHRLVELFVFSDYGVLDSLLQDLSRTFICYVIDRIFTNLMLHKADQLFSIHSNNWLKEQPFVSESGTLKQDAVSISQFRLFYQTFDAPQLAETIFDSHVVCVYKEAVMSTPAHYHALGEQKDDSVLMLVSKARTSILKVWVRQLVDAYETFLTSVPKAFLDDLSSKSLGIKRHLIRLSDQLSSVEMYHIAEIPSKQLFAYAVFAQLLREWIVPKDSAQHQSLFMTGDAGLGKSFMTELMVDCLGFATIDFEDNQYQNPDVATSQGFCSKEVRLPYTRAGREQFLTELKKWSDWSSTKQFKVKGGIQLHGKRCAPFVTSTNDNFAEFFTSLSNDVSNAHHSNAIKRRLFHIRFEGPMIPQLSFTNQAHVEKNGMKSLLALLLTLSLVNVSDTYDQDILVYEHQGANLYGSPVDKQPLKTLFDKLRTRALASSDVLLRLLFEKMSSARAMFTDWITLGYQSARRPGDFDEIYALPVFHFRADEFYKAVNIELNDTFNAQKASPAYPSWLLVKVAFSASGFQEAQLLYDSWFKDTGRSRKDPMALVKFATTGTFSQDTIMFWKHVVTHAHDSLVSVKNWVAYMIILSGILTGNKPVFAFANLLTVDKMDKFEWPEDMDFRDDNSICMDNEQQMCIQQQSQTAPEFCEAGKVDMVAYDTNLTTNPTVVTMSCEKEIPIRGGTKTTPKPLEEEAKTPVQSRTPLQPPLGRGVAQKPVRKQEAFVHDVESDEAEEDYHSIQPRDDLLMIQLDQALSTTKRPSRMVDSDAIRAYGKEQSMVGKKRLKREQSSSSMLHGDK